MKKNILEVKLLQFNEICKNMKVFYLKTLVVWYSLCGCIAVCNVLAYSYIAILLCLLCLLLVATDNTATSISTMMTSITTTISTSATTATTATTSTTAMATTTTTTVTATNPPVTVSNTATATIATTTATTTATIATTTTVIITSSDSTNVGVIVAPIIVVLLIAIAIIVLIIVLFFWRKKQIKSQAYDSDTELSEQSPTYVNIQPTSTKEKEKTDRTPKVEYNQKTSKRLSDEYKPQNSPQMSIRSQEDQTVLFDNEQAVELDIYVNIPKHTEASHGMIYDHPKKET